MKRRARVWVLVGYLAMGGYMMQAGACWSFGANTVLPGAYEVLLDSNGRLFGLINMCGQPDIFVQPVDQLGQSTSAGTLFNQGDDLVTVCPQTTEFVVGASGSTGSGT